MRTFDRRVPAGLVVAEEDEDARLEAPHLGAELFERALDPVELAERALALRRRPTSRTARALR